MVASGAVASKLTLSNVRTDRLVLKPETGENLKIRYHISAPARVVAKIYDSRNILVRKFTENRNSGGDYSFLWDGKDESGNTVPTNFYYYTVSATSQNGRTVTYDLTDLTGGEVENAQGIKYDSEKRELQYVLPKASIVNIRIGYANGGPLLRTLIDWVPRPGGLNVEKWDGWDNCHVVNVKNSKNLQINVSAYSLPMNSIIVQGLNTTSRPEFIENITWQKEVRQPTKKAKKQMYNHWQHPRDRCYDPVIKISALGNFPRTRDGLPVVSSPLPIQTTIPSDELPFMFDQRFEVVYYVDFVFLYEEELGYVPFTWKWDPKGVNEGVHYITVMLRGYEGHFGSATMKVYVKPSK